MRRRATDCDIKAPGPAVGPFQPNKGWSNLVPMVIFLALESFSMVVSGSNSGLSRSQADRDHSLQHPGARWLLESPHEFKVSAAAIPPSRGLRAS